MKRVGTRCRNRDGIYNTIDLAVCKWVEKARGKGYAINTDVVMEKAIEFSKIFKVKDFSGSRSWLARLKKRRSISFKRLHCEAKSADVTSAEDYIQNRWPHVFLGYKPHEIFNFDEFGNFYKGMSTGTLAFNEQFQH